MEKEHAPENNKKYNKARSFPLWHKHTRVYVYTRHFCHGIIKVCVCVCAIVYFKTLPILLQLTTIKNTWHRFHHATRSVRLLSDWCCSPNDLANFKRYLKMHFYVLLANNTISKLWFDSIRAIFFCCDLPQVTTKPLTNGSFRMMVEFGWKVTVLWLVGPKTKWLHTFRWLFCISLRFSRSMYSRTPTFSNHMNSWKCSAVSQSASIVCICVHSFYNGNVFQLIDLLE